jgi:hypothetical protein
VAVAEEAFANVRADEARAASDEKIHGRKLTSNGRSVECSNVCSTKSASGEKLTTMLPIHQKQVRSVPELV